MKYTFFLIATGFIIAITLSDAAKVGRGKSKKEDATVVKELEKVETSAEKRAAGSTETSKKKKPVTEAEDGNVIDSVEGVDGVNEKNSNEKESSSEEEDEEVVKPSRKKTASSKPKPTLKNKQCSKKKPKMALSEEVSEEEEKFNPKLVKQLENLQKKLKSVNPESLVSALRNTPEDKLSDASPQLKELSKTLRGTPLGPIIQNLTSLVGGGNPQMLNSILKIFPNFLSMPITTVGRLGSIGIATAGRLGKSAREVGDAVFNGVGDALEDLEGVAGIVPGADPFFDVAKQGVRTFHGVSMDPLDEVSGAMTRSAKSINKELERSQSRRRLGGSF